MPIGLVKEQRPSQIAFTNGKRDSARRKDGICAYVVREKMNVTRRDPFRGELFDARP